MGHAANKGIINDAQDTLEAAQNQSLEQTTLTDLIQASLLPVKEDLENNEQLAAALDQLAQVKMKLEEINTLYQGAMENLSYVTDALNAAG